MGTPQIAKTIGTLLLVAACMSCSDSSGPELQAFDAAAMASDLGAVDAVFGHEPVGSFTVSTGLIGNAIAASSGATVRTVPWR